MKVLSVPPIVVASILFYAGFYHLMMYVGQTQHRKNLTLALTGFTMGLYSVFCACLYSATSVAEGAHWQRLQAATLALVVVALLWFIVDFSSHTTGKGAQIFSIYFALIAIVQLIDRSELTWLVDQPAIKNIQFAFGPEIVYYVVAPGPVTHLQNITGLGMLAYILWISIRFYQRGRRGETISLLGAMVFLFASLLNDVAVNNGFYQFIYVLEYACLGIAMSMMHFFSVEVVGAVRTKDALQESEERLGLALRGANLGMWDWNVQTGEMIISRWVRTLKYAPDEIEASVQAWKKLVHPDDVNQVTDTLNAHVKGQAPFFVVEYRFRTRSGEWRWVLSRGQAVERGRDGQALRVAGTHLDIHERKRSENVLRIQRDLAFALNETRDLTESLSRMLKATCQIEEIDSGGVYLVDGMTGELDLVVHEGLSPQFVERISHYSADSPQVRIIMAGEPMFRPYSKIAIPQDKVLQSEGLRAMAIIPVQYEGRVVAALNLASHTHDDIPAIARDEIESIAAQAGSAIARVKAEEGQRLALAEALQATHALQESELKFRSIIESIPLGMHMYRLEPDGELVFSGSNPAAAEILGIDHEQFMGKTIKEAFPSLVETETPQRYRLAASEGQAWRIDQIAYQDDRIVGAFQVHAFQTLPGKMVAAFLDITDRKRADDEREALIAELEAKNAEMERFTYTVSHDLKSPLITIKGFLGFLEQDAASGNVERMQGDIDRIAKATTKMQQLLDELLELSRIGRLINPPEWVSLDTLAREAVEMISGLLIKQLIVVEIAPDLPKVYGDRIRLQEVLQNLIGNAAKFMGDEPDPHVQVGVRQDGDENVFYVRDNGMGIDPRYHDKIFGLFERLDQKVEGTGIGLAIVKRIIEMHGGRIWVESQGIGHGSTLCFTLPEPEQE